MLVRKVGLKGRPKLADQWEEYPYMVIDEPCQDMPVFKVKRMYGKRQKLLHRNMVLPLGTQSSLPLSGVKWVLESKHYPTKCDRDLKEVQMENADSDSSEDEDMYLVSKYFNGIIFSTIRSDI